MSFVYVILLAMFAYSTFVVIAPERFVRYQIWYYRKLFGARVAEPGRGTFQIYRLIGIFGIALTLFAFIRSPMFS